MYLQMQVCALHLCAYLSCQEPVSLGAVCSSLCNDTTSKGTPDVSLFAQCVNVLLCGALRAEAAGASGSPAKNLRTGHDRARKQVTKRLPKPLNTTGKGLLAAGAHCMVNASASESSNTRCAMGRRAPTNRSRSVTSASCLPGAKISRRSRNLPAARHRCVWTWMRSMTCSVSPPGFLPCAMACRQESWSRAQDVHIRRGKCARYLKQYALEVCHISIMQCRPTNRLHAQLEALLGSGRMYGTVETVDQAAIPPTMPELRTGGSKTDMVSSAMKYDSTKRRPLHAQHGRLHAV